ncbi:MAG: DUF2817 domain-containing protein, partial [Firmicutes bacterium]|nr:DUF2817 domain-containing protein [Bacillota bacterium]
MRKSIIAWISLIILPICSALLSYPVASQESSITSCIIGYSVLSRPIELFTLGGGEKHLLLMGVFHGDEPQGRDLLYMLMGELLHRPALLSGKKALFIPVVNPDGLAKKTRVNANGVDLNRNFPCSAGGERQAPAAAVSKIEPETQAVVETIEKYRPARILSIHAPLRCVNYDGPASALAMVMAKHNHYPVKSFIGYPTPGSLGTYAGKERNYPVITLELPAVTPEEAWRQNRD